MIGFEKTDERIESTPSLSSIIKPQLSFNESLAHLPFWAKLSLVKENVHMGSGEK